MLNNKHLSVGKLGEQFAEQYFIKHHYQIITKNYKKPWGELDLVVFDKKSKEIVFVEVKTITVADNKYVDIILPEEELTMSKLKKIQKTILSFLTQYQLNNKPWRFDFLALEMGNGNEISQIRYYKDIYLEF